MKGSEARRILDGAEGKPIWIDWWDAHVEHVDAWVAAKDLDLNERCQVETAGLYIGMGSEQVWVSQASLRKGGHHSNPFAIPLGCIESIRILK